LIDLEVPRKYTADSKKKILIDFELPKKLHNWQHKEFLLTKALNLLKRAQNVAELFLWQLKLIW
jgi:hypothetical protein